jgi:hypothetical protein
MVGAFLHVPRQSQIAQRLQLARNRNGHLVTRGIKVAEIKHYTRSLVCIAAHRQPIDQRVGYLARWEIQLAANYLCDWQENRS